MKTKPSTIQEMGSVLLVTLVVTGILGFTLASYLTMIGAQNRSVARSQTWNASVPVAEAGIEEALMHLNKNCLGNFLTGTNVDWTADGWTAVANGYQKTRSLGENHYKVTIVTASPHSENRPAILSEGYVPALLASKKSDVLFAATGADQGGGATYVGRKIRVTTAKDGLITGAMIAKEYIDFNGNGVQTDSYDSEDPAYSTDGRYDSTKSKDNGDVAVNYSILNGDLDIGNANIYGAVAVGPGGKISIGPNGAVGDKAWHASHSGIQPGKSRNDMNVSFPDVVVPFTGGYSTPTGRTVTNEVIVATSVTNVMVNPPTDPGTVYTNTVLTTTASYPVAGTYIGSVVTNTVYTNTAGYPASGTYIGTVITNTVTTNSLSYPTAGTYIGTVGTNYSWYTNTYPAYPSGYYGGVITNSTSTTTSEHPPAGSYVGTVTTNWQGNSGKIKNYTYAKITSYKYQKANGYSYEKLAGYNFHKITGYTVAKIVSYSLVQSTYVTNYQAATYDYVLDAADNDKFQIGTLNGKVLVMGGDVSLHVTSSLSANEIEIAKNARLKLFMSGSSFSVSGTKFVNKSGDPDRLWYFGLPSNKNISLNGNGGFCGVIYAPHAHFALNGGGSNTEDFIGASLTKSVKMNGHFHFHYDESLARKGLSRGYLIQSWDEVSLDTAN